MLLEENSFKFSTLEQIIGFASAQLVAERVVLMFMTVCLTMLCGRRGGLMVSALDSGASAPGSSPGRGHCVVFLGKTLYSHGASLHPGVNGYRRI